MMKERSIPLVQTHETTPTSSTWHKSVVIVVILFLSLAMAPIIWRLLVLSYYANHIYIQSTVPKEQVAIVFGAAVYDNGRLSSVLRDRMETAIALYQSGGRLNSAEFIPTDDVFYSSFFLTRRLFIAYADSVGIAGDRRSRLLGTFLNYALETLLGTTTCDFPS